MTSGLVTTFRNIEFDETQPVDAWPMEAIETILDRGSLSDWKRLAGAIRSNPWGPAARNVETVSSWGEHYGSDQLMLDLIASERRRLTVEVRGEYADRIRRARDSTGLSLRAFAAQVGTSASRLSNYESAKVAPTTDVLGRIELIASRLSQ